MPSKRLREEDEFVLTLSDNDTLPVSEGESTSETEPLPVSSKKRKRSEKDAGRKSSKKKRQADTEDEQDLESGSQSDNRGIKDEALDSDFEFDIGPTGASDTVEDFDGWAVTDAPQRQSKPPKKTIDLDEIIARRAQRLKVANNEQGDVDGSGEQPVENSDEHDHDSELELDFDDENLADDTFGAGADTDDADDEDNEAQSDTEMPDGVPDEEADDTSDTDSVASAVAHPDDISSDADSDAESQTSQEDPEEAAKRKAFFADETDQKQPSKNAGDSFQQFSLSRPILRGLATLNFSTPTPIQVRTIPVALQGLDVVGSAQTGSGKTAAFLLPILERLLYRPRKIPTTRVAILMPTRELAVQCHSVAVALARFTDITFAQIVGGFSLREQEAILKKRPDVIIATPGRFIDHMRNSASFTIENLEILVLDEADRMLEQGFADELDEIIKTIPRTRQTMLFSATMTSSVDKLVRVGMNKPVRLSIDSTHATVAGLTQEFLRLRPGRDTPELRLATLCTLIKTVPDYQERTIIFFRQKKEAHRIRIILSLLGIKAGELHGSMTQDQRIAAVTNFRSAKTTHLLATDVASRGLDIKNVHSIINFEAPQTHEIYLHRVGRTARAGKSGKSCTLASDPDRKIVKAAVKAARSQGAKVTSRILDQSVITAMAAKLEALDEEIDAILIEEKEQKQLAQMESEVTRGQNMVAHHDEIMSRPKRTWFESEKEKRRNQEKAKAEVSGGVEFKGEKKKLSNKERKKLDLTRERKEGRQWKKKGGEEEGGRKEKGKGKGSRMGTTSGVAKVGRSARTKKRGGGRR